MFQHLVRPVGLGDLKMAHNVVDGQEFLKMGGEKTYISTSAELLLIGVFVYIVVSFLEGTRGERTFSRGDICLLVGFSDF